jgi:competence protein ComEC
MTRVGAHAESGHRLGASDPRQDGPADLRLVPPAIAAWAAAAMAVDAPMAVALTGAAVCLAAATALLLRRGVIGRARWPGRGDLGSSGSHLSVPRSDREDDTTVSPHSGAARRVGIRVGAAAAALACAAAAATSGALHTADLRRGPLPEMARHHADVTVELTVTGDPHLTRPRVRGTQRVPGAVVLEADAERVTGPDGAVVRTRTPVLVIVRPRGAPSTPSTDGDGAATSGRSVGARTAGDTPSKTEVRSQTAWLRLLPSTRLRVRARAAPPMAGSGSRPVAVALRVAGGGPPRVVGDPSTVQRAAGALRAGLREATGGLSPDARALLPGLVVGDTSRVPSELEDAFRATDLTHLLAVSGANLTIVLALLIGPPHLALSAERRGLAPRLGISLRTTALLGGLLTLGFVIVCRPDPSVLRAAACGFVTLLAIATGRRRSLLPALATAVLLLVLYDPWLARSYGFLLSVLATAALLTIAPRWSAALQRRRVPPRLAEVLAAAAAAQAVCAPVVAALAAHVSLVAVACNLLAEVAVGPATVLGFAALGAAPVAPPVATGLAWLASWPAEWIAGVARTGAALPGAEMDWPGGWRGGLLLAAVTVVAVLAAPRLLRSPWLCATAALFLLLAIVRPAPLPRLLTGWPPPGWRFVACDVGQGDALALSAGGGTGVVVDAGPDPELTDRCLHALGITRIPLVVLTHFHADHVAGLPGVLRGREVGAIETTTLEDPTDQAAFVRRVAAHRGIPVIPTAPGERRLGSLRWRVLWPTAPTPAPAAGTGASQPLPSQIEGPNNASVTLLVRTAGLTLLLPGDLEPPSQQGLLAAVPDLPRVDVLKVAHHGSAYQDLRFLARVHPRLALISCGEHNPYGHPSPRTIAILRREGAAVLRTDIDGAIAVTGTAAHLRAAVSGGRTPPPGRPAFTARRRKRARARCGGRWTGELPDKTVALCCLLTAAAMSPA